MVMNMVITSVRHDYPEKAGFKINRPSGHKEFTFLHFMQRMHIEMEGKIITTEPNACIIFVPNAPQYFYNNDTSITHNWMHFKGDYAKLLDKYNIPLNTIFYPNDCKFLSRLFYKIENEFYSDNPFKEELVDGYFNEVLIRLSRKINHQKNEANISPTDKKKLQEIRHIILTSSEYPWTVEELAKRINLSASRFHFIYKAMFGISPMKDVIENRIQNAANLLVSTDLSVSQIGETLGYANPHHFIRQFKSNMGETPLQYRKSYTKQ